MELGQRELQHDMDATPVPSQLVEKTVHGENLRANKSGKDESPLFILIPMVPCALPPVTLLSLQFCALLCAKKEVSEEGVGTSSITAASSNEIS